MKSRSALSLCTMIIVAIGLLVLSYFGIGEKNLFGVENIKQGLDLKGGVSITYEADKESPTPEEMNAAISMIRGRLDRKNYTEAEVGQEGTNRIRVEIPGVDDAETAISEIGRTALLQFADESGNVLLDGSYVKNAAKAVVPSQTGGVGEIVVTLDFNDAGKDLFSQTTASNIGKPLYIVLDDAVISSPMVNTQITDGSAYISGNFTTETAEELASLIRAGSLPFKLEIIDMSQIGARLGADSLMSSIYAGILGTALIILFMILVYKMMGMAANLALFIYVGLMLIILSAFGITLTLPGIAGIILSVAMAVDANIVIFERIKEEIISGKSLRSSIKAGFSRALPAIIDVNLTTLIAAAVLYWLGTGPLKGFAQTLSVGVILSMLTAIVITRSVLYFFVELGITEPKFYVSGRKSKFVLPSVIKNRKLTFIISGILLFVGAAFMIVNSVSGKGAFELDVEFSGGTSIQIDIGKDFNNDELAAVVKNVTGQDNPQIQRVINSNDAIIKIKSIDQDTRTALVDALLKEYNITQDNISKISDVSATIGSEMRFAAVLAVSVACIGMLIYISFRFRDFKKGSSAILALLHDALIVVCAYAILRIPLNYSFIAVLLTILGFSINATIIIFDRVRENRRLDRRMSDADLMDESVRQTLTRSVYTSFLTLLAITGLYILGVDSIKEFTLPIIIGIVGGLYSSTFLSGAIWYILLGKNRIENE